MSALPHACNCPYCPSNMVVREARRIRARDLTIEIKQFVEDLKAQGPDNTPGKALDLVGRLE